MIRSLGFLLVLFLVTLLPAGQILALETDTVYSTHVKDKFIITVKKPVNYSSSKKYHLVYITDGTIGIGEYILGTNNSWKATVPDNCIIIAIGHIGNWHDKRPRDLIPSDISKNVENDFGKADKFYLFLQRELIPMIERKFPNRKDRVFIGHSFGGLFCLYTLFQPDRLFDRHFAISPSIWANYYELDKIEAAYSKKSKSLNARVVIYVGTLEFLNKVLYSSRGFYKTVSERKYAGLTISKDEIGYANHFSIRKPAVDKILESLKD
jgi:predicted alpha/beta superfamily hydrolase